MLVVLWDLAERRLFLAIAGTSWKSVHDSIQIVLFSHMGGVLVAGTGQADMVESNMTHLIEYRTDGRNAKVASSTLVKNVAVWVADFSGPFWGAGVA
ncbi:proline oxidase PrnD [Pyricularia oryzae]|nr:proline oxidase PrnD [Pyricularia oryzae]